MISIKNLTIIIFIIWNVISTAIAQPINSSWKSKDVIIFEQDNKYGMIDYDNKSILKPIYDEIISYPKYNLYIAKKENKFSYAIKQWGNQKNVEEDVWIHSNELFDSLFYYTKFNSLVYRQNNKYGFIYFELYKTNHYKYEYSMCNISKEINEFDTIFPMTDYFLIVKKDNLYGAFNKYNKIIEPQFKTLPKLSNNNRLMIVQNEDKFGAFNYYNFPKKITFPFDEAPIDFKNDFYFAKKEGLWGLIYPNIEEFKNETPFFEIIPFNYEKLTDIKKDLRYVIFIGYNPFDKYSGNDFVGEVFTTTVGTSLSITGYIYHPSYKNYYYTYTPMLNGQPIVQDSINEYLFNEIDRFDTYAVLKVQRTKQENLISRGNYFIRNAASGSSYMNGPTEPYEKQKLKSVITYQVKNDSLIQLYAFNVEADSITYDILYSSGTGVLYRGHEQGFGFVLKSSRLKEQKFLHEFFDYYGTLLYSIKSKHPITHWNSTSFPFYEFSNYGIRVCRYNGDIKRFYR